MVTYFRERRMTSTDADLIQPWRKAFPICKPPTPGSREDAIRFSLKSTLCNPMHMNAHGCCREKTTRIPGKKTTRPAYRTPPSGRTWQGIS